AGPPAPTPPRLHRPPTRPPVRRPCRPRARRPPHHRPRPRRRPPQPASLPPRAHPPWRRARAAAAAVVPPAAPAAWQGSAIETEPGPMPGVGFAPHAARLIAYIIDAFIIGVVVTVVPIILTPLLVAGSPSENTGATAAAVFLYVFVVLLVS